MLTPHKWEETQRATREARRPGEFVTFLGYEWGGRTEQGGDHDIYFLADEGPLVHSAPYGASPAWDAGEGTVKGSRSLTEAIRELEGRLAGRPLMIVPHGGGRRCNLDYTDSRYMPLLEISSCHRSHEHIAHEAIRRGLRLGFIADSDDHRGALGDSHPAARERFFSCYGGLVAAYAKELTRESLWKAFFARRVYATNGPRMVVDFRINDVLMGGEVRAEPGQDLRIVTWTRLDGLMDRIELVRGTETIRRIVGTPNRIGEFQTEIVEPARIGTTAYYVRIFQTDGGTAWSSPIWVSAA
jgi:hypothetical protein